jgi:acyl-CoA dehydrogenase
MNVAERSGEGCRFLERHSEAARGAEPEISRFRVRCCRITPESVDDPDIAVRPSEVEVDIDTLEMTELRVLSALQTGQNPGAVSSLLMLRVSEIRQAVTKLGVDVIGHDGLAVEPARPFYRLNHEPPMPEEMLPIVPEYLNGRAYTIFGGSSEIQREIVAKMVLGL